MPFINFAIIFINYYLNIHLAKFVARRTTFNRICKSFFIFLYDLLTSFGRVRGRNGGEVTILRRVHNYIIFSAFVVSTYSSQFSVTFWPEINKIRKIFHRIPKGFVINPHPQCFGETECANPKSRTTRSWILITRVILRSVILYH